MDDIQNNMEEFDASSRFEDEAREFGLRNVAYKKLEDEFDLPEDIRRWMDVRSLRVMCNKRHREMKKLAAAMSGDNESERNEAEEHLNRYVKIL